jgi:hypothetical protein
MTSRSGVFPLALAVPAALVALTALAAGAMVGAAQAADPVRWDASALAAMPVDGDAAAFRTEGRALAARLAPLREDARFGPLKAEFEAAAANRDPAQRKAALRAVVDKAAPLRAAPAVAAAVATAAAAADKRDAPPRITRLSPEIAHALGAGTLSIHPSQFDKTAARKRDCPDSEDMPSFPGGDPFVKAISTPAIGDSDCDLVSASRYGATVTVPEGTKTFALTAQLDYTLNADTYAVGAWARASSQLVLLAISDSVRFTNGFPVGPYSMVQCTLAEVRSASSGLRYSEREAREEKQQVACKLPIASVASGRGEVTLAFAVRASIDADLTAVAQADARLSKIRGVQVVLQR